ncbi:WD40 repeat domain-containing protein [Kitasatospora sp. NPDC088134]|uniref:WD40 repeat domain-containing protein n=1 Tax=Kitasatospora sp. NPDC088134 TaxID=3364071 RepID=UPI0038215BCB
MGFTGSGFEVAPTAQALDRHGELAAEADRTGAVLVRGTRSGEPVASTAGPGRRIETMAFGTGAATGVLALGSSGGGLHLWRFDRGDADDARVDLGAEHPNTVTASAWSPDGTRLLSGDDEGGVHRWEVPAPGRWRAGEVEADAPAARPVQCLAWHPDGRSFAVGHQYGRLQLRDVGSGALLRTFREHGRWSGALAFDPAGAWLVEGGRDADLIWYPDRVEPLVLPGGHRTHAVAVAPDGTTVAVGGQGRKVRLWDSRTGAPGAGLGSLGGWIEAVAFSADGREVVAVDADRTIARWDVRTGELLTALGPAGRESYRPEPGRPVREWERIAAAYDWSRLPCTCKQGARHVPGDFARMLAARTEAEVDATRLLDHPVRGGLASEAALPVARMALAAFRAGGLPAAALRGVTALMGYCADSDSNGEAYDNGRPDLGAECREALLEGVPLYYGTLATTLDNEVSSFMIDLLRDLGEDGERVMAVFEAGPQ